MVQVMNSPIAEEDAMCSCWERRRRDTTSAQPFPAIASRLSSPQCNVLLHQQLANYSTCHCIEKCVTTDQGCRFSILRCTILLFCSQNKTQVQFIYVLIHRVQHMVHYLASTDNNYRKSTARDTTEAKATCTLLSAS